MAKKNNNEEYIDVLFEKKRIRHEMKRNKMSHVYQKHTKLT